jgi:carbon-monoxide dehydrogenase small subunit
MASLALLRDNPSPDEREIREELSGNICRCTGYQSIIEGVLLAAALGAGQIDVSPARSSASPPG